MYVCVCHVCMCICMCICMYMYICIYVCMYACMYMYEWSVHRLVYDEINLITHKVCIVGGVDKIVTEGLCHVLVDGLFVRWFNGRIFLAVQVVD